MLVVNPLQAIHLGRAAFDGRFSQLELRNLTVAIVGGVNAQLLERAQSLYGPDAQPLLPLPDTRGGS